MEEAVLHSSVTAAATAVEVLTVRVEASFTDCNQTEQTVFCQLTWFRDSGTISGQKTAQDKQD